MSMKLFTFPLMMLVFLFLSSLSIAVELEENDDNKINKIKYAIKKDVELEINNDEKKEIDQTQSVGQLRDSDINKLLVFYKEANEYEKILYQDIEGYKDDAYRCCIGVFSSVRKNAKKLALFTSIVALSAKGLGLISWANDDVKTGISIVEISAEIVTPIFVFITEEAGKVTSAFRKHLRKLLIKRGISIPDEPKFKKSNDSDEGDEKSDDG